MKEEFKTVDWSSVFDANDVNIALMHFNVLVKAIFIVMHLALYRKEGVNRVRGLTRILENSWLNKIVFLGGHVKLKKKKGRGSEFTEEIQRLV